MGVDIRKRKAATRKITVDIDGETLNIEFRPAAYTPNLLRQLQSVEGDAVKAMDASVAIVIATVASWDLEDDGVTVPLTKQAVGDLPFEILTFVVQAVAEAQKGPNSPPSDG